MMNLLIWDTAGQEMYRSMIKMYYRGVQVAIIVYDLTDKNSFLSVPTWIEDIKEKSAKNKGSLHYNKDQDSNPKCIFFVVGNKSDKS